MFFAIIYGVTAHKAPSVASGAYSPTDEFKLDTWFSLGPIAFNKAVLYVLLTVADDGRDHDLHRRPPEGATGSAPGRGRVVLQPQPGDVERQHGPGDRERKYFPLIATLFVFILVTNLIGYIPLPVNSSEKFTIARRSHLPSFQIYAADTNVAFPLILALGVFVLFNYEGIKYHGFVGYFKSLIPAGIGKGLLPLIAVIEVLSIFLRLISLTVRLWANLLAGHLLIAFMAGELGVLVGQTVVSWALLPLGVAIFLFEAVLIAGLQAFIFAILTAIYLGGAVSSH